MAVPVPDPAGAADRPVTILQLFDWRFDAVAAAAPALRRRGVTHLHVSPPQASNEAVWQWWGRYQPVSHNRIGGPLGDAAEFAAMTRAAAAAGLAVVADVVPANPCGPEGMLFGCPLDTAREQAFRAGLDYLGQLHRLGARGFRIDGAQRAPPEFLAAALRRFPGVLVFGEIVSASAAALAPWTAVPGLRLYDFPQLAGLRAAFAPGGALPALEGAGLPDASAVRFLRNHDIERGQAGDHGIDEPAWRARFGVGWDEERRHLDRAQLRLATAWLFGRRAGAAYTLAGLPDSPAGAPDRPDEPWLAAALRFRRCCGDRPEEVLICRRQLLVWRRGRDCWGAINTGGGPAELAGLATGLRPGRYRDLLCGRGARVAADGRLGPCTLPRGAGLWLKLPDPG